MDKYHVMLSPKAYRDLDSIYEYIATVLIEPETALHLAESIESAVLSLHTMPNRGSLRKVGVYAGRGYRQLFVKNYIIIYRVDSNKKQVIVLTIQHANQSS